MKIDILSDVAVSPNRAQNDSSHMCAYPQIAVLGDGSIACLYRQGTTKHSHDGVILLQTSSDLGQTWSSPVTVFDGTCLSPRQTAVSGGVGVAGSDDLIVAIGVVEGLEPDTYVFDAAGNTLRRLIVTLRSRDRGRTWKESALVDFSAFVHAGIPAKPFVLPDGKVALPLEVQLQSGVQATAMTVLRQGAVSFGWETPWLCVGDTDGGQLNLCDARFTNLPNGDVLMLLWTFQQNDETTINVHRSVSHDGGKTWSDPEPTAIQGQVTGPLALRSGLVIAATNYRVPPAEGSYLWISRDGGTTWDAGSRIRLWDERRKAISGASVSDEAAAGQAGVWGALQGFTFGTPDLAELADGTVLLTYYATLDGIVHVRACRFRVRDAGEMGQQADYLRPSAINQGKED